MDDGGATRRDRATAHGPDRVGVVGGIDELVAARVERGEAAGLSRDADVFAAGTTQAGLSVTDPGRRPVRTHRAGPIAGHLDELTREGGVSGATGPVRR